MGATSGPNFRTGPQNDFPDKQGELFNTVFPEINEAGTRGPFPAPVWKSTGKNLWKLMDRQSLLRLSATNTGTQRNKYYLFAKSSAGRVPGMRAYTNEN